MTQAPLVVSATVMVHVAEAERLPRLTAMGDAPEPVPIVLPASSVTVTDSVIAWFGGAVPAVYTAAATAVRRPAGPLCYSRWMSTVPENVLVPATMTAAAWVVASSVHSPEAGNPESVTVMGEAPEPVPSGLPPSSRRSTVVEGPPGTAGAAPV